MDDQAMTQIASPARPRGWYYGWNITAVCILSQVAANGLNNTMTVPQVLAIANTFLKTKVNASRFNYFAS